MTQELISGDSPKITRDEASEFTLHHLRLAAMFYESTPDDPHSIRLELERLTDRETLGKNDPWVVGAKAFLEAIEKYYEGLRE